MNVVVLLVAFALFLNSSSGSDSSHNVCSGTECINDGNRDQSAITCDNCVTKGLSSNDTAEPKSANKGNVGRKRLADLYADVLSLIFDEMRIMDMMQLIDVYPAQSLSSAAQGSFRRRFRDHEILLNRTSQNEQISVSEKTKCINVETENVALRVLQVFGDHIYRLDLQFPSHAIIEHVIKYTNDHLIELKLRYGEHDSYKILEKLNKPFKQLKDLSLRVNGVISRQNLTFVEIFPNIQRLCLRLASYDGDYAYFIGEHKQLESLELFLYEQNDYLKFKELLRKSPHIKSLSMVRLYQGFANMLNEYLPELETLDVSEIRIVSNTRFDHLKHLRIRSICDGPPMNLVSLPKLESVDIEYAGQLIREIGMFHIGVWIDFFRRHPNVNQLKIVTYRLHDLDVLIQLLNGLPNLVELTLNCYDRSAADISVILQRNPNIAKLNLLELRIEDSDVENLRETFANEWNINKDRDEGRLEADLLFEKIH